jgi:hypothetical protein
MYVYVNTGMRICTYAYMYICLYLSTHVCMYVHSVPGVRASEHGSVMAGWSRSCMGQPGSFLRMSHHNP